MKPFSFLFSANLLNDCFVHLFVHLNGVAILDLPREEHGSTESKSKVLLKIADLSHSRSHVGLLL